jgi:hypothetical protein
MIRHRASSIGIVVSLGLTGCSGLTQLQDTISKYDQGVHSVSTGQMAFFRQVQMADCNNQFYSNAYAFAINKSDVLDLSGTCNPTILDANQIKSRQALMDSLTLYVDKIQTLATNDTDKALDANSRSLAEAINGLAKSRGLASLSHAEDIEAALIAISEMALDQRRFGDIRNAAQSMMPFVKQVVEALKTENSTFAIGMASKMDQLEPQLHLALVEARDTAVDACRDQCAAQKPRQSTGDVGKCVQKCQYAGARSLLDVIAAREVMRAINPLGASPVSVAQGNEDPKLDPRNVAKQLNGALDSVVNANDALASAGTGGIAATVNDLVARAQNANNILAAISK